MATSSARLPPLIWLPWPVNSLAPTFNPMEILASRVNKLTKGTAMLLA
jgi:hypothetical protein